METLIHADIFFFITSIAVIILTILLCICLYYLSGALKNFRDITDTLKANVENASDHFEELIERVEENAIFRFIFGGNKKSVKKKKTKTK